MKIKKTLKFDEVEVLTVNEKEELETVTLTITHSKSLNVIEKTAKENLPAGLDFVKIKSCNLVEKQYVCELEDFLKIAEPCNQQTDGEQHAEEAEKEEPKKTSKKSKKGAE